MSTTNKPSLPFVFAIIFSIALHLAIVAMFGYSYFLKDEVVEKKPPPEIINATVLDDKTIMAEAKRLKTNEKNKKIAQQKKQEEIEDKRKKEEALFQKAKENRENEEKKAQELEKKRNENELKEKKLEEQRKEKAKTQKVEEAARLAKIKKQEEKKRQDDLRKAEEKKRVAEKKAKQEKTRREKAKREKAAKQKSDAAERDAEWAREVAAEQAAEEEDRLATISVTDAIMKKVNSKWRKPPSATKGMNCVIQVELQSNGDVIRVSTTRGSGDSFFDRSAELAVHKASPLPVPKNRDLFMKKFKSFKFEFEPE